MDKIRYSFQTRFSIGINCLISGTHDLMITGRFLTALEWIAGVILAAVLMRILDMPTHLVVYLVMGIPALFAAFILLIKIICSSMWIEMAREGKNDFIFSIVDNEVLWYAEMEDGSKQELVLHDGDCRVRKERYGKDTFYTFSGTIAPTLAHLMKGLIRENEKELCYLISRITLFVRSDDIENAELREHLDYLCQQN